MKILITNDDGIYAPGIEALATAFAEVGDVTVVGPEFEKSGVSHALTFLTPLFAHELDSDRDNVSRYAVSGTPSDCTKLGIVELCGQRPDLIVSGINGGYNVGINCVYSGTLAGAREGAFFGIPSFAVSVEVIRKGLDNPDHMEKAARLSRELILKMLGENRVPPHSYINMNYPISSLDGSAETVTVPMETVSFRYEFQKGTDPAGRPYYWTGHHPAEIAHDRLTDVKAVEQGMIAVTPMTYDLTDHSLLE